MKSKRIIIIVLALLSALDVILLCNGPILPTAAGTNGIDPLGPMPLAALNSEQALTQVNAQPIAIRAPSDLNGALSAAGTVELLSKRQVVLEVDGTVQNVAVAVGDTVQVGDLLVALSSDDLARTVARTEADLQAAVADLQKLQQGSDPGEITVAEANLAAAQENLLRVQAGATAAELAAAQAKVAAAQAKYSELQAPPSNAALDEARAEMEKAQLVVQDAQRAYDKVAWMSDIGMQPESVALQKATIDLQQAQGKFNRLNVPTANSSLQETSSEIQKASAELQALKARPNPAEVAEAQAKVTDAEQKLLKLRAGAAAAEISGAEAKVTKLQLDLEEAQDRLAQANLVAPVAGTVLEINVAAGERGNTGKVVATIADLNQLKLTVKVAEVDIPRISVGQQAKITIDTLREQSFNGVVEQIDPINKTDKDKDVVNYPVTIRLTDPELAGVRPGMNAVVDLAEAAVAVDQWLAPTSALQHKDGITTVRVLRGEGYAPVVVTPLEEQGEWTLVQSAELQAGDKVIGNLPSYLQTLPGLDG